MKRWTIFFVVCLVANALCVAWDVATDSYFMAAFNAVAMVLASFWAADSYRKGE